jgi:hypothetical protein
MNKIPENKTRKRLRITLCVLYLFQLVFCAWPYYGFIQDGHLVTDSVFEMLSALGTGNIVGATSSDFSAINRILPLNFIFVIIPVIGFFFCAFDKERNLKNIVSLLCALAGVVSILTIVTINLLSLGSMLALLFYILISFLSMLSIFARYTKSKEEIEKEKKQEIQK